MFLKKKSACGKVVIKIPMIMPKAWKTLRPVEAETMSDSILRAASKQVHASAIARGLGGLHVHTALVVITCDNWATRALWATDA